MITKVIIIIEVCITIYHSPFTNCKTLSRTFSIHVLAAADQKGVIVAGGDQFAFHEDGDEDDDGVFLSFCPFVFSVQNCSVICIV